MYRWQTLTLARVEAETPTAAPEQHKAARDLVLAIGQKYFPEPTVSGVREAATPGARNPYLAWQIDDRLWEVEILPNGACKERASSPGGDLVEGVYDFRFQGDTDRSPRDEIAARIYWLLFGRNPMWTEPRSLNVSAGDARGG